MRRAPLRAAAPPRPAAAAGGHVIMCVSMSLVVIVLVQLWRWTERQDPEVSAVSLGPQWARDAYGNWPRAGGVPSKAAYFLRALPQLSTLMWHQWFPPDVATLVVGAVALVGARVAGMELGPTMADSVLISTICVDTLRLLGCKGAGEGVECGDYARSSVMQCPPCLQTGLIMQFLELMMSWRLGIAMAQDRHPLWVYAGHWAALTAKSLVLIARYGVRQAPGAAWPPHAPQPPTWRALAAAAASSQWINMSAACLLGVAAAGFVSEWALPTMRRRLAGRSPAGGRTGGGAGPAVQAGRKTGEAGAAGAAAEASSSPPVGHSPLDRSSQAAPRAEPAAPQTLTRRSVSYSSHFTAQRGTLLVKTDAPTAPGGRAAAHALLDQRVPSAVAQALHQVGSHLPGGAPLVLFALSFPGCHAHLVQLQPWPQGGEGAVEVAAALPTLLPPETEVLAVADAPAGGRHAVRLDPVCLDLGEGLEEVAVLLPPELVQSVEASGWGLRVVVSTIGSRDPLVDVTLRAGEGAWPSGSGRLPLALPRDAGRALTLALLRAPPPERATTEGSGGGGVPRLSEACIAVLVLPVLPAAATADLQYAWRGMVSTWAGNLPDHTPDHVAAVAYHVDFAPFAQDLAVALHHAGATQVAALAGIVLSHLMEWDMTACAQLLQQRWQGAGEPLAAAATGGGGEVPPVGDASPAAGVAWSASPHAGGGGNSGTASASGSGGNGGTPAAPAGNAGGEACAAAAASAAAAAPQEPEYAAWKASQLAPYDPWVHALVALMGAMVVAQAHARGGSATLLTLLVGHTALVLMPLAGLAVSRRAYLAHRGTWWAASVVLHAAYVACMGRALMAADVAALAAVVRRPWTSIIVRLTLTPALQQMSRGQRAVCSAAQLYESHMLHVWTSGGAAMPLAAYLVLPAVGVVLAGACDMRLRRAWERSLVAAGISPAGAVEAPLKC